MHAVDEGHHLYVLLHLDIYPLHLKMQDSAGFKNAFRQGIDCREWLLPSQNQ